MKAKAVLAVAVCAMIALSAVGCGRVEESSEVYKPISQTAPSYTSSIVFNSVDSSSKVNSMAALGEFFIPYNESTNIQRVYGITVDGKVNTLAELIANEQYEAGPISPDGSKLFLYRVDPEASADTDHRYGVIVDLQTGATKVSSQPMFESGTVNWAGNDRLFTANRRIVFFSAFDFSATLAQFQIMQLIQNDPDGKYVLTGMAYDSAKNRYVAAVAEKPVGKSELTDLYKTKLHVAVIDSYGNTSSMFEVAGVYSPVDDSSGAPLAQTVTLDSSELAGVYSAFIAADSSEPFTSWTVVDCALQQKVSLPDTLREGVLADGVVCGLTISPYGPWWENMSIRKYTGEGGKYTVASELFTQSSESRYVSTEDLETRSSYELFRYPDGRLLLKAFHSESGYTRLVMYNISTTGASWEVYGALPGKGSMRFMICGIDALGGIWVLSDC